MIETSAKKILAPLLYIEKVSNWSLEVWDVFDNDQNASHHYNDFISKILLLNFYTWQARIQRGSSALFPRWSVKLSLWLLYIDKVISIVFLFKSKLSLLCIKQNLCQSWIIVLVLEWEFFSFSFVTKYNYINGLACCNFLRILKWFPRGVYFIHWIYFWNQTSNITKYSLCNDIYIFVYII